MAEERVQRRLAAILAADVVGYSRLMGADEAGTLARLNALRNELLHPKVSEYGGRIVKTTGDGTLIEFPSAVDAVQHAVDVQQALARRNADVHDKERIELRMGVNLGDIIVQDEDIFGDGVNVAARLEALADPGGICISDMVRVGVGNRLALEFTDLGEQSLKNIAEPVRVFRIETEGLAPAKTKSSAADAMFRRPAVAVLPFQNISGDPEQDYFADGLTEDIITALSLWKSFPVIARNSSFAYKGQSPDIRKVGEELGARYVIEGSVRKGGSRVRVSAQLINSETAHHVWAEKFDRDVEEIFDLQDELSQRIAATVAPEVERTEHNKAVTNRPKDLNAWDHVQKGLGYLYEFSLEGNKNARAQFDHALEIDPSYGTAYIGIAWSFIRDLDMGSGGNRSKIISDLLSAANMAVRHDPTDSFAHVVLGIAHNWDKQLDASIVECERALELNPNNTNALMSMGHGLSMMGRRDEGLSYMRNAISLNPRDPRNYLYYSFLARALLTAKEFYEAHEAAKKAISWNSGHPVPHLVMAATLAHLGRIEDAREEMAACERSRPGYTADPENWVQYRDPADNAFFLDGLRKAGWEG